MNIKDIVKNNEANFSRIEVEFNFYRNKLAYYDIEVEGIMYTFPVDLEDLGQATISRKEKAITLMRYIRKALEEGTFVKA